MNSVLSVSKMQVEVTGKYVQHWLAESFRVHSLCADDCPDKVQLTLRTAAVHVHVRQIFQSNAAAVVTAVFIFISILSILSFGSWYDRNRYIKGLLIYSTVVADIHDQWRYPV